jgi:hypothetical protein
MAVKQLQLKSAISKNVLPYKTPTLAGTTEGFAN